MKQVINICYDMYIITDCTAIPLCDNSDESKRQPALLVEQICFNYDQSEYVVFGFSQPEDDRDLYAMFGEPSAWEPLEDAHKLMK